MNRRNDANRPRWHRSVLAAIVVALPFVKNSAIITLERPAKAYSRQPNAALIVAPIHGKFVQPGLPLAGATPIDAGVPGAPSTKQTSGASSDRRDEHSQSSPKDGELLAQGSAEALVDLSRSVEKIRRDMGNPLSFKISDLIQLMVFLLLLYQLRLLSKQLEDARRTNRASQYQAALQLMFDWRSEIIAKPELADGFGEEAYFKKAFGMLPRERYFHLIKLFHIFEHYWLLHDQNVIEPNMWIGWSHNLFLTLSEGESRQVWDLAKEAKIFNSKFVAFVEKGLKDESQSRAKAAELGGGEGSGEAKSHPPPSAGQKKETETGPASDSRGY